MTVQLHSRLIFIFLCLYFVATWCSMAAMEIVGWSLFLLVASYAARTNSYVSELLQVHPWRSSFLLLLITALGFAVNGQPDAEWVFGIGSQRWIVLFPALALAITLHPPKIRGYKVFATFIIGVALYAVFQSITGIDLMRPGSNRAVQPLYLEASTTLWRSAGFFGSPLQYGYIAGMHVCLPLAMFLLLFQQRERRGSLFWLSLAAYILVSLSIVTTFTRGAWIAMALAHFIVALVASPRFGAALAGAGAAASIGLYSFVDQFRVRFDTLFDSKFNSNFERIFLWRANLEMFKDYPILGIGYQENERRAGEYVARLGKPDAFTGHAHNNYIQMLSGTGITGFVAYMFLITYMIWLNWNLWKNLPKELIWPRAIALACLGAQIHLHIGGFTECNFKAGATNHNFMIVWALVVSLSILLKTGTLRKVLGPDQMPTQS